MYSVVEHGLLVTAEIGKWDDQIARADEVFRVLYFKVFEERTVIEEVEEPFYHCRIVLGYRVQKLEMGEARNMQ